jgi:hypothetical protein
MIEMAEEVIYISPCEPEFMSLNLLMLYFEKEASFQTALQSIEKDHPEVLDSRQFDAVLGIVSMLSKQNYAQYLRTMSETRDLLLGHVLGMPEFLNTVRVKYFGVLKLLFAHAAGSMATEGLAAPLGEWQRRLHIDSVEEMKYYLTFMHGKKNRGFELFSVERDAVNLEHYTADAGDLLGKIGKIKMNRPLASLKALLAAGGPTNKREAGVKGPKLASDAFVKAVHKRFFAAGKLAFDLADLPEEDEPSEELPELDHPKSLAPEKTHVGPLKAETSLTKTGPEVDKGELLRNLLIRKKKGAELSLLLLKKKVRTTRRDVFRLWSMYSVAKSVEQLEKLKQYLDSKNEQTRFDCFDLWRLQVYKRRALLEEIMDIPDFDGYITDVVCEEYAGLTFLPDYNCHQTFIMIFFRHLLRKWFEILAPQTILSQNLSTVKHFSLSWLFIVDQKSSKAQYLAPFLGVFLLTPEESLEAILEGKTIECEYFIDNWIDREGRQHGGRLRLTVSLECRSPHDLRQADLAAHDFVVDCSGDPLLEAKLDGWCAALLQASETKYTLLQNGYFASFADLVKDSRKNVIFLDLNVGENTVSFRNENLRQETLWQPFNYVMTLATSQAFLSVCLKRLNSIVDWIDENFFSGQFLNLKIMDQSKVFTVEGIFFSFYNALNTLQSHRVSVLTDEDYFLDPESQNFFRKTMQIDYEGFFFLRNLLAQVVQEMIMEGQVLPREHHSTLNMLENIHKALLSEVIHQDVYLNTPRNMVFYKFISGVLGACSPRWPDLFEEDINKLLWTRLIALVTFDEAAHFSGDWLAFFTGLLECMAEVVKRGHGRPALHLLADFETRMLLDLRFETLAACAIADHKAFLMRQFWNSQNIRKFNNDLVNLADDSLLTQNFLIHEELTQQTETPSVSDPGEANIWLGKRIGSIEYSFSSLDNQYITRLLKL